MFRQDNAKSDNALLRGILAGAPFNLNYEELLQSRSLEASAERSKWRDPGKLGHKKQLSSIEDTNNENVSDDERSSGRRTSFVFQHSLQHSRGNSAFNQDQQSRRSQ